MIYIIALFFIVISVAVLKLSSLLPRSLKSEGQSIRHQVDELATQLRTQLDRVEAQQRSMTENVITLKSYTIDKTLTDKDEWFAKADLERNFFNALVREMGIRIGGCVWIVDASGRFVGEASGGQQLQSLSNLDMPMAVPLRRLLAQSSEGMRQTQFRTASGEHTLIVQTVSDTVWQLAIDVPSRYLGDRASGVLHQNWPIATLILISTLTLMRGLNHHLSRLHEELPALLGNDESVIREHFVQLPAMLSEISTEVCNIANVARLIAQKNEFLNRAPGLNSNRVALLADSASGVVQAINTLQQSALQIADTAGRLVELASRAYSYSLHDKEGIFAVEARNLAQRCARSSKELRKLITDANMQADNTAQPQATGKSNIVLIEEMYTLASVLLR